MATCPSCGRRAHIARLVMVSPRRPYLCAACGARSRFDRRRDHLVGVVAVIGGVVLANLLGPAWGTPARVALTVVLILAAIGLARLVLPLHADRAGDTFEPRAPL